MILNIENSKLKKNGGSTLDLWSLGLSKNY